MEKATFGDVDIVERLFDYLVARENELFDAIRQIDQREQYCRVSHMKIDMCMCVCVAERHEDRVWMRL